MILMILLPEVPSKPASNCQSNPSLNAAPKTLKFTLKNLKLKIHTRNLKAARPKPEARNPKPQNPEASDHFFGAIPL